MADFTQLGVGFAGERVAWIEAEKFRVGIAGLGEIAEIVLPDFAFGEQGAEAEAAAGVLSAEEFVLADSVVEVFVVLKDSALFGEQIGDSRDRGVGFGRGGIAVVDGPIGVENAIVLEACALLFGAPLESLAKTLSVGEGCGAEAAVLRGGAKGERSGEEDGERGDEIPRARRRRREG